MLTFALVSLVTIAQTSQPATTDQGPPTGTTGTPSTNSSPPVAVPATPAAPAVAPTMPGPMLQPAFQFSLTTLELLRRKGLISDVEYATALSDMSDIGQNAAKAPTVMMGKFATTLYGFVEADFIHDSTRGFIDLVGNTPVTSPANNDQYNNGQTLFGARNSRIGFRIKSPDFWGFRPSAMIEADFLNVSQPGVSAGPAGPTGDSKQRRSPALASGGITVAANATYKSKALSGRTRPSASATCSLKLDNDIVSIWMGQNPGELVRFSRSSSSASGYRRDSGSARPDLLTARPRFACFPRLPVWRRRSTLRKSRWPRFVRRKRTLRSRTCRVA